MEENIWHLLPTDDLEEHKESSMCRCNPEVKIGEGGVLIVHNSFDGREGLELAKEILNSSNK